MSASARLSLAGFSGARVCRRALQIWCGLLVQERVWSRRQKGRPEGWPGPSKRQPGFLQGSRSAREVDRAPAVLFQPRSAEGRPGEPGLGNLPGKASPSGAGTLCPTVPAKQELPRSLLSPLGLALAPTCSDPEAHVHRWGREVEKERRPISRTYLEEGRRLRGRSSLKAVTGWDKPS